MPCTTIVSSGPRTLVLSFLSLLPFEAKMSIFVCRDTYLHYLSAYLPLSAVIVLLQERNRMAKYGLRPRTLKGELFNMLSVKGSGGLKVSDMANASQVQFGRYKNINSDASLLQHLLI